MSAKTQRLALDLERNEELASLVADMEPGQKLDATLSIVARDDKTLTVEVESVSDRSESEDEEEEDEEDEDADYPAMKVARGM
ncbi:MAG: hypothetical protein ACO2YV_01235 [Pseudomonadales bacterium]